MNINDHPCFNAEAHHRFGRVHLPVAPRCNIQCKFCNRRFDCANESRPGVTSAVLTPAQAMIYLDEVLRRKPNIRVVGIAGPGDPFANAEETLETCRRIRMRHPEMILCIATNGLNLMPHIDALAEVRVSHVTVTVNAVDPAIGEKIYAWMRVDNRVTGPEKGARILLERQKAAIAALKARGIVVKVNSIVLPGINEDHIETVAREMAALDVDLFNAMPYHPNAGSAFEHMNEPPAGTVNAIREAVGRYLKPMRHCTRCRADAVGRLGEAPDRGLETFLTNCQHLEFPESGSVAPPVSRRPFVAVASREGVLVNEHLGEARQLLIYGQKDGRIGFIEARPTPAAGAGRARWQELARRLSDCGTLLVGAVGETPRKELGLSGIEVIPCEGLIDEAVDAVYSGIDLRRLTVRRPHACGAGCGGGLGCG